MGNKPSGLGESGRAFLILGDGAGLPDEESCCEEQRWHSGRKWRMARAKGTEVETAPPVKGKKAAWWWDVDGQRYG